jgi:CRISPR-associated protein (TIGR03984 family)
MTQVSNLEPKGTAEGVLPKGASLAHRQIDVNVDDTPGYRPHRVLIAVSPPRPLSASDAITWLMANIAGAEVREAKTSDDEVGSEAVGFMYSPNAASWFRLHGTTPWGPHHPVDISDAYELHLFDAQRELRWLHHADGLGTAVAIAETGTALPEGTEVSDPRRPSAVTRIRRILAGNAQPGPEGWSLLTSPRYSATWLPIDADTPTQSVGLLSIEYAVQDGHGNLTAIDARLVGLDTASRRTLPPSSQDRA